jgi:Membrane-bound lytic murein transglycosylase
MSVKNIQGVVIVIMAIIIAIMGYSFVDATKSLKQMNGNVFQLQKTITDLSNENENLKTTVKELNNGLERQRESYPVSRGGRSVRGIIKDSQVTWYNDQGRTASGTYTTPGKTVAVDPSVVPLGSWIDIVMPDGTVLRRKAEDTGSAVKGKVFDINVDASTKELSQLGRVHGVTVFILGNQIDDS